MNPADHPAARGVGATLGRTERTVYEQVLGDGAALIHPEVRRLHMEGASTRASGTMHVRRGRSWPARLIAVLLRLPAEGDRVVVHLSITRGSGVERWCRVFGDGAPLNSLQHVGRDATLVERYGPLALQLTLAVDGTGLRLRSRGARLQVGGSEIRLPRHVLRVAADVQPGPAGTAHVAVLITAPVAGPLLSYHGHIRVQEPADA